MDSSKLPVTRAGLERILARAAELQAAAGDTSDGSDTLTEGQVVELGREVGLSPAVIRQALAEERAHITPAGEEGSGLAYQLLGASRVAAQRVVRGSPVRILDTIDRWMQRDELLRVVRQRPDTHVWEPAQGFVGSLRRAFGSRDYALFRANEISATVIGVEEGSSLVRLEADYSGLRGTLGKQSVAAAVVGSGISGVAVMMAVAIPAAIAVLPGIGITAAAYYRARNSQRHALHRAALTLEQILDRLERGDMQTPSLLRMIESALPPSR